MRTSLEPDFAVGSGRREYAVITKAAYFVGPDPRGGTAGRRGSAPDRSRQEPVTHRPSKHQADPGEAGRPASDVPYWDAVAALTSPPDMGRFPVSMAAQGCPDLTREVMLERRDTFLDAALSQLAAG